jgi:hypothetical protein
MLNDDGTTRTTESVVIYSQKGTENPVSGTWVLRFVWVQGVII